MTWQALDTLLSSAASSRRLSLRLATLISAVMSVSLVWFWWYKTHTRTTWPLSASADPECQVNTVTAHPDDVLSLMGEPKLGKAGGDDPCHRFFVRSKGGHPLMIKYLMPSKVRKSAEVEIKIAVNNGGGWTLSESARRNLSAENYRMFETLLRLSDIENIPLDDWSLEHFDGTCWIFEIRNPDGFRLFYRRDPRLQGPANVMDASGVYRDRLIKEHNLFVSVVILCVAMGVEIEFED